MSLLSHSWIGGGGLSSACRRNSPIARCAGNQLRGPLDADEITQTRGMSEVGREEFGSRETPRFVCRSTRRDAELAASGPLWDGPGEEVPIAGPPLVGTALVLRGNGPFGSKGPLIREHMSVRSKNRD